MFDNDADTQVLDNQNQDAVDNSADQDQDQQQQDEFFLTVNDRTKYRTKEDAVKAYSEAGQRIAQLSPWEKVSKKFGGLTPEQNEQLLQEYIKLRQQSKAQPAPAKQDTIDGKQLTPQQQEVVKFLKDNGFSTKEAIEELKAQIAELKKGTEQIQSKSQEQVQQARIEYGRNVLRQQLVEDKLMPAKFANDEEKAKALKFAGRIESVMADYLGEDEERLQRFYAGGDEAKAVVLEAYKDAIDSLGLKDRIAKASTLANDKKQVLSRNSGGLPPSRSQSNGKPAPKAGKGITSDVHNKAWEMFERVSQEGGES